MLRDGRDEDAGAIIALVAACWAEYPGCIMDLDGEVPELRALASYCARRGGRFWVAEWGGDVAGLVTAKPLADGVWEVGKMYVAATARGTGVAQALLQAAEAHARAQGATRVALWTDTRFDRAHRFYEKSGYVRSGPLRVLNDKSNSIEFAYAKPIAGAAAERLDAAGVSSAVIPLALVLQDCVNSGASVSFLPPLDTAVARSFWQRTASAVATGRRMLFAGWLDGNLAGTVTLDLDTPQNQPHRADIAKLLVRPAARRRGLARLLMQQAEQAAWDIGRTLLVLDTRVGDDAEPLYRALGWQEAGRIPDYALNADGKTYCDTILFWKRAPA